MSNNNFCPECSTLLRPMEITDSEDSKTGVGLYLFCGDCSYREKADSFTAYHFNRKIEKTQYVHPKRIVNDYIYDMTLPRTKTLECVNKECPSHKKENPEIILIPSNDHPEIAYLCSVCKFIWGRL